MAKTFEEWKDSLPKCIGFEGGCDGDLVGLEHEDNCPMKGKEFATLEDAFHARDADFAALEQRILELESANAVEREKIRDEALVEAARAVDAMICPIPSDYRGMKVSSDLNSRAVCDKILGLRMPR